MMEPFTPAEPIIFIPNDVKGRRNTIYNNPDSDPEEDYDFEPDTLERFWDIIKSLQWRNASDGECITMARAVITRMNERNRVLLREKTDELVSQLVIIADNNDIFGMMGIEEHEKKRSIASHVVALGKDAFNTTMDAPQLLQFLIAHNECQPFINII